MRKEEAWMFCSDFTTPEIVTCSYVELVLYLLKWEFVFESERSLTQGFVYLLLLSPYGYSGLLVETLHLLCSRVLQLLIVTPLQVFSYKYRNIFFHSGCQ